MDAGTPPRFGPAASPGFLLWHVNLRWQSLLAERLAPLGLTPAQFTVLGAVLWLERIGGTQPPMQREVADRAGTDRMMTSQILRTLEQRKLVVRREDPNDLRARRVSVTPAGERAAAQAVHVSHACSRDFFEAPLGDVGPFVANLQALARAAGVAPQVLGEGAGPWGDPALDLAGLRPTPRSERDAAPPRAGSRPRGRRHA